MVPFQCVKSTFHDRIQFPDFDFEKGEDHLHGRKFGSHTRPRIQTPLLFDLHQMLEVGGCKGISPRPILVELLMSSLLPKPRFPRDDRGSRPAHPDQHVHPLTRNGRGKQTKARLFRNLSLHINSIN